MKGYSLMQGLYKVEREDSFDREGFYHTGDAGYFDADGVFFFKARLGDMIKTAGANVTPREVEIVMESQPEIRSAFVVGVPDPVRGQNVAAAVILKAGSALRRGRAARAAAGRALGLQGAAPLLLLSRRRAPLHRQRKDRQEEARRDARRADRSRAARLDLLKSERFRAETPAGCTGPKGPAGGVHAQGARRSAAALVRRAGRRGRPPDGRRRRGGRARLLGLLGEQLRFEPALVRRRPDGSPLRNVRLPGKRDQQRARDPCQLRRAGADRRRREHGELAAGAERSGSRGARPAGGRHHARLRLRAQRGDALAGLGRQRPQRQRVDARPGLLRLRGSRPGGELRRRPRDRRTDRLPRHGRAAPAST